MQGHDEPRKGIASQGNEEKCTLTPGRSTRPANSAQVFTSGQSPWLLPGLVALLLLTLVGTAQAQELVHALPLDLARTSIRPLAPVVQGDAVTEELLGLLRTEQEALAEALPLSNEKLATRLEVWSLTANALSAFARKYPESPWTAPLLYQLGVYSEGTGRPTAAREYYAAAWEMTRQAREGDVRKLAHRTLAQLGMLLLQVADLEALDALITDAGGRTQDGGAWVNKWLRMREVRAKLRRNPDAISGCGVRALYEMLKTLHSPGSQPQVVLAHTRDPVSSMASLSQLARQAGVLLTPALREVGQEIPVPSIVHWQRQHFSAVLGRSRGCYRIFDPLHETTRYLSAEAINLETSGRFLIPQALPVGWRPLTPLEADSTIGRHVTLDWDSKDQPCPDGTCDCPPGSQPGSQGGHGGPQRGGPGPRGSGMDGGGGGGGPAGDGGSLDSLCDGCLRPADYVAALEGMTTWAVSEPYLNLWLHDVPFGYSPSIGPAVRLKLSYKQRESDPTENLDGFTSFGVNWNSSWTSYVFEDGGAVYVALPGGGLSVVPFAEEPMSEHIYGNNLRGERVEIQDVLTQLTIHHADGSQDVYDTLSDPHPGVLFLTQRIDPQGRALTLGYANTDMDAFHLVTVTDADGHTSTLTYDGDTDLVESVTDYTGRTLSLGHDASGQLTSITDVAGITSSITYDAQTGWPATLTTPYGETVFDLRDQSEEGGSLQVVDRFALVDEPEGACQVFVWLNGEAEGMSSSYSASVTPKDGNGDTWGTLDDSYRNLWNSFHWNRRTAALLGTPDEPDDFDWADFKLARIRHWLGTGGVDTLSVEQAPSPDGSTEGQITWFDHEGKPNEYTPGDQILPSLIAQVIPGQPNTEFRYAAFTRQAEDGKVTEETRSWTEPDGDYGSRTRSFEYDDNKIDLLEITDFNGQTIQSFTYNGAHQILTSTLHPNGTDTYTTTNTYATGRLASVSTPVGLVRTFTYGEDGYVSGISDSPTGLTESFTWLNGYPHTHTDGRGLIVTNTYDHLGRVSRRDYNTSPATYELFDYAIPGVTNLWLSLSTYRDRLGHETHFTYNGLGQMTTRTDALNRVTYYDYCGCGSLDSITDALSNTTTFTYDHQGRLTAIAYPDDTTVSREYNLLGQLTEVSDAVGSRTFTYNTQGLLTQVETPEGMVFGAVYDADSHPTVQTNANGVVVSQTYDRLGRVLTRTFPDSGVESFGHGPVGVLYHTNQLAKVTAYEYDDAGRLTDEHNANDEDIAYGYNAAGDLISLTHGGQETTWDYDMFGRVTNKVDALDRRILAYAYDAVGRLTSRWSAAKGTTVYTYDDVGNLLTVNYPVSADLTFTYDALNRLATMSDAVGTTTFAYDEAGNLDYEDGPWSDDRITYGYHASAPHLRTGLTLQQPASTWTQSWDHDQAHRIDTLTSPSGEFVCNYHSGVNGSGRATMLVEQLDLPGGAAIVNDFDTCGRLLWTLLYDDEETLRNAHGYDYDAGWRRTAHARTDSSYTAFTYDSIGQLKTALGTNGLAQMNYGYVYDARWNLTARTNSGNVQAFAVNALNHLTSGPAASYGYDTNGNLRVESSGRVFTCDDENQLVDVYKTATFKQGFVYDGLGRMRKCTNYTWSGSAFVPTSETRYLYDGRRVIQERNSSNVPTVSYTRGLDLSGTFEGAGGIGGLLARSHGYSAGSWSTHSLYHADGGGNVTMLIDASTHDTKATYKYDPYGNTLSATGDLATANVYRFSSKEWHASSGLYYYGFRFYEPNLQRWLNRDPIAERGGLNLFMFAQNDPMNLYDTLGLWTLGFGFRVSFSFIVAIDLSVGVHLGRDPDTGTWSGGGLASFGLGTGGPVAASAGGFAQWTTAKCVADLKGDGYQLGIGAKLGVAAGVDLLGGLTPDGDWPTYAGIQVPFGIGVALFGLDPHAGFSGTVGWDTDRGWRM